MRPRRGSRNIIAPKGIFRYRARLSRCSTSGITAAPKPASNSGLRNISGYRFAAAEFTMKWMIPILHLSDSAQREMIDKLLEQLRLDPRELLLHGERPKQAAVV